MYVIRASITKNINIVDHAGMTWSINIRAKITISKIDCPIENDTTKPSFRSIARIRSESLESLLVGWFSILPRHYLAATSRLGIY